MEKQRAKSSGQDLRCRIHPLNTLDHYIYVVICSFYEDKVILSRQRNRQTWETQGGHIEEGESPLEAAKRELFEESGILNAAIIPVCDYDGYDSDSHANGMVFAAVVRELGRLPDSEMEEVRLFDQLPRELSYPLVTPTLVEEASKTIKEIHSFAKGWLQKIKTENQHRLEHQFELSFGDECMKLGFRMDCGHEFEKRYPHCFNISNNELDKVIDNIDDVCLLGSAVLSQWRYLTHWAMSSPDAHTWNWFTLILTRMLELTTCEQNCTR